MEGINQEYMNSMSKPSFTMSENNINIILAVIEIDRLDLSEEEIIIYNILKEELELSRRELDNKSGFDKSKTLRTINSLVDKKLYKS